MNNPYHLDDLLTIVQKTLVTVLGCGEEDVGIDVALGNDLDADSLDFVEMRYSLEKQLGIMLPQKSVLDHLAEALGGEQQVYNKGRLTELAAFALHKSLFRYSKSQVRAGIQPYDVMAAGTVGNWVNLCHGILSTLPDQCPDCGHDQATVAAAGKPACGSCGAILKPLSGDAAMAAATPAILAAWQQQSVAA